MSGRTFCPRGGEGVLRFSKNGRTLVMSPNTLRNCERTFFCVWWWWSRDSRDDDFSRETLRNLSRANGTLSARALVLPDWSTPPIMHRIDCFGVHGCLVTRFSAHVLYKHGNRKFATQRLLHSVQILVAQWDSYERVSKSADISCLNSKTYGRFCVHWIVEINCWVDIFCGH